jgi:hypothetical protein
VTGIVRVLKRPAILRVGAPGGAQIQLPAPMVTAPGEGDANLLLDTLAVQPVASYCVARKLRSSFAAAALRNRRSSDSNEVDIGFAANLLDSAALLAHTGANSGFTRTIYDQSGAFNIGNASALNQPQIVNAGALNTSGGRASLFGAVGQSLLGADVLGGTTAELMVCVVSTPRAGRSGVQQIDFGGSTRAYAPFSDNAYYWDVGGATSPNRIVSAAIAVNNQVDILTFINSTAASIQQIWRNGVLVASDATAHTSATVAFNLMGDVDSFQEALVFNAAGAIAQRDAITRNQGAFYGVAIP